MIEAYDRQDAGLLSRSTLEPRLVTGAGGTAAALVVDADPDAPWLNAQDGYARGVQVTLQRRSANGFSGWMSYAYSRAVITDARLGQSFASDYDQRHTINAFLSRRLSPTIHISGQFAFGSGMPLPGFYARAGSGYQLATQRNALRAPYYQRTDLRINKAITRTRFDATLFAELINVTNHTNRDFDAAGAYNPLTAETSPTFFSMFPILPSVGLTLTFARGRGR